MVFQEKTIKIVLLLSICVIGTVRTSDQTDINDDIERFIERMKSANKILNEGENQFKFRALLRITRSILKNLSSSAILNLTDRTNQIGAYFEKQF